MPKKEISGDNLNSRFIAKYGCYFCRFAGIYLAKRIPQIK
jgi:hypothetical protein